MEITMSMSDTGAKPKRRPTTYGKVSRRAVPGYQSPDEDIQKNDSGDACTQETLVGRIRKTSPMENSSMRRNIDYPNSDSSVRANNSANSESKRLFSSKSGAQSIDLFDVPSSDDNKSTSQAKPVAKKRRVQEKSPKKLVAIRSPRVLPRHAANPTSEAEMLLPPPEIYRRKQKNLPHMSVKQSNKSEIVDAVKVQPSSRQVGNGAVIGRSDKVYQQHKGRAVGQGSSLESTFTENGGHRIYPDKTASPRSSRQVKITATRTSPGSPRTPPRNLGNGPSLKDETHKYLSPSGLDIPGLSISSVPSSLPCRGTPQQVSTIQTDTAGAQRRIKVKDRLTNKDGLNSKLKSESEDSENSDSSGNSEFGEHLTKSLIQYSKDDDGTSSINHEEISGSKNHSSFSRSRQHFTGSGPRVTYTARQRTLRQENSEDDMLLELAMNESSTSKQTRRLDIHNSKFNFPAINESDDTDNEPLQVAPVRTIHELRQAGGNARVFSQAETILDDIDSNTISLKRSGILELDTKLQEPDFRAHFTSHGLITRLLISVRPSLDLLTKSIFAIPILRILAYDNSSQTLDKVSNASIVTLFQELLAKPNSLKAIAKDRSSNASKAIQQDTIQMCEKLSKSSLWRLGLPQKVTPRIISLQCLDYLLRHLRETGVTENLLNKSILENLLKYLRATVPNVEDADLQECGTEVKLILSILESSTLLSRVSIPAMEEMWSHDSIEMVTSFLILVGKWVPNDGGQIWCLTLRLSLNLISRSTKICKQFARSTVIDSVIALTFSNFNKIATASSQEEQAILSDSLVLSLGFLLVLAEAGSDYRSLFIVRSSQGGAPLDILLDLFNSRWQKAFEVVSEDELRRNVPLGFLAALLSYLSIDPSLRKLIASRLEGGNLRHLLIAVSEFLVIYQKTEEIRSTDDDVDLTASFVDKLRVVVETLQEQEKIK